MTRATLDRLRIRRGDPPLCFYFWAKLFCFASYLVKRGRKSNCLMDRFEDFLFLSIRHRDVWDQASLKLGDNRHMTKQTTVKLQFILCYKNETV